MMDCSSEMRMDDDDVMMLAAAAADGEDARHCRGNAHDVKQNMIADIASDGMNLSAMRETSGGHQAWNGDAGMH